MIIQSVHMLHDTAVYSVPAINFLTNINSLYDHTVKSVFADTGRNYTDYPEHQTCLSHLQTFDASSMSILKQLSGSILTYSQSADMNAMADATDSYFYVARNNNLYNFTDQLHDLEESCWWMNEIVEDSKWEDNLYNEAKDHGQAVLNTFSSIMVNAMNIGNYLSNIISHMEANIYPVLKTAEQYRDKTTTKLQMSEVFAAMELTKALDDLLTMNNELQSYVKTYKNILETTKIQLDFFVKALFKTYVPVMSTSNIKSFMLIQIANESGDPDLMSMYTRLSDDHQGLTIQILNYIMDVSNRVLIMLLLIAITLCKYVIW